MDTADRQNIEDGTALVAAQASATSMALFGLLHELVSARTIDLDAIARIERFTIASLHQGGASEDAAQALEEMYRHQFAQILRS